jgi:hypothetical protein
VEEPLNPLRHKGSGGNHQFSNQANSGATTFRCRLAEAGGARGGMEGWPPRFGGGVDRDRQHWLQHQGLLATEIRLTPSASSLVAIHR